MRRLASPSTLVGAALLAILVAIAWNALGVGRTHAPGRPERAVPTEESPGVPERRVRAERTPEPGSEPAVVDDAASAEPDHADAPPMDGGIVVRGTVRDTGGQALVGATVALAWLGREGRSLGATTTDEDGAYHIAYPGFAAVHPLTARAHALVVAAEFPGHVGTRRTWADWPAPDVLPGEIEIDLVLPPGRRLVGRVVGAEGEPVSGAELRYTYESQDAGRTTFDVSFRSDAEGRFRAGLQGAPLHLSARAWNAGVASRSLIGLGLGLDDVDVGDVVLRTLGTLSGRAVLPDGTTVSGVLVVAARVDDGVEPTQAVRHDWFDEPEDETGLPVGRCITDEQGAFHMAGLASGPYVVYAVPRAGTGELYARRRVASSHVAGSSGIQVVVDFPRLLVTLLDPDGLAVPRVRVICDLLRPATDGASELVDRRMGLTDEDGTIDFRVQRGGTCRLTAEAGALRADRTVVIPESPHRLTLVLESAEPPSAGLRVHVVGVSDRLLRESVVRLLDPATGDARQVLRWSDADAEGGWPVSPGTYDVEVEIDVYDELDVYDVLVPVERGVVIEDDAVRDVHVRPFTGGRFRLTWRAPSGAFPPGDRTVPSRDLAPTEFALFQNEWGAGVEVRRIVENANAQSREPWWTASFAHATQEHYHELRLLPDEPYRCRLLLEPGRYAVRVTCRGFEQRSTEVTIRAGEEAQVALSLAPR